MKDDLDQKDYDRSLKEGLRRIFPCQLCSHAIFLAETGGKSRYASFSFHPRPSDGGLSLFSAALRHGAQAKPRRDPELPASARDRSLMGGD